MVVTLSDQYGNSLFIENDSFNNIKITILDQEKHFDPSISVSPKKLIAAIRAVMAK